jgi:hypothetical protein
LHQVSQAFTGGGELNAAFRAQKKFGSEIAFQIIDAAANRGGRFAERACGTGHAFGISNQSKNPQPVPVKSLGKQLVFTPY